MSRTWRAAAALITSGALVAVGWGAPAHARDNGNIALYSTAGLVVLPPSGGDATYLGHSPGGYPAFAPDGSRIAVVTTSGALTTFLPNGTGDVTVANGVSQGPVAPAWSPDSTKLAYFAATHADMKTLVISNATAGATQAAVTEVVGQLDGSIAWSPNGATLLYSTPDGIWSVPATSGATPALLNIPGPANRRDFGPAWSPDGSRFAFVRDCGGCADRLQSGLWTAAATGSDPKQVTVANIYSPASWSPDGKQIAFVNVSGGVAQLRLASTQQALVTLVNSTVPGLAAPSWGGARSTPTPVDPTPTPQPIAPVNDTPPELTGNLVYGKKLTVSPGTWRGDPTKYTYQWLRCEKNPRRPCLPISGATKATHTIVQADLGVSLQAKVTAANAVGKNTSWTQRTLVPMPPKGKSVTLNIKILFVGKNGRLTVPVELKGTQPILSATVSVENYGENVKSLDDAKKKVNVPVELSTAGRKKVNNRPVVLWTFKIFVVSKVNGKIFSSEGKVDVKVTAQDR